MTNTTVDPAHADRDPYAVDLDQSQEDWEILRRINERLDSRVEIFDREKILPDGRVVRIIDGGKR